MYKKTEMSNLIINQNAVAMVTLCIATMALFTEISSQNCKDFRIDRNHVGLRMEGYMIFSKTATSVSECVKLCVYLTHCQSFNYASSTSTCELNTGSSVTVPAEALVENDSFMYSDISVWPKILGGVCGDKPCTGRQWCTPGYIPICTETDCPYPPAVEFATPTGSHEIGAKVTYTCQASLLVGTDYITCLDSREWSTVSFTCEKCPAPPSVQYATASTGSYDIGGVTTYTCQASLLVGTGSITCSSSAEWSDVQFSCQKCSTPPSVQYATSNTGSYDIGGTTTYTCLASLLVGTETITCLPSAEWSAVQFSCQKCPAPPSIQYATASTGSFDIGGDTIYTCQASLLVGTDTVTCSSSAEWSDVQFSCQKCPDPPSVQYATANTASHDIDGITTYTCQASLSFGTDTITCTSSAEWSNVQFSCQKPTSCDDVKTCDPSYPDGEYWLYPAILQGSKVKVFCHDIVATPKEYITVNSATNDNYNAGAESGANKLLILWSKIRIDTQTMTIDRADMTHSDYDAAIYGATPIEQFHYGNGASCNCHTGCGGWDGYVHIDTAGTGLIVDPTLAWEKTGWAAEINSFERSTDGQTIYVKCGGFCGHCFPNGDMVMVINTNEVVPDTEATFVSCV